MAMCSFEMPCRCSYSKAEFSIRSNSKSVHLLCLNISGSVNDNNNINDPSCLTSSKITVNYCSTYLFEIFSIIDSSSFPI